jgi:aminomethyltransferase
MKKTILYDEHLKHGAKIVEFGGYLMPIEYTNISLEHQAVRKRSGLFDVSHMGEIEIKGEDATKFINYLTTNDLSLFGNMKMAYGLMLYENGGVVDDLMIYKYNPEHYLLVVNASNKDKDYDWIMTHKSEYNIEVKDLSDEISLLAIQGPFSVKVLQSLTEFDLSSLVLFDFAEFEVMKRKCMVSRSGYTGEDGFEIYASNEDILYLFKELATLPEVSLCGLGARDTLRFEAAMPLYGHEISEDINPLEAGLGFAVKLEKDFIGRTALLKDKEEGLKRKIVGIELLEKGIARSGYEVFYDDEKIGYITTGYMIPNTDKTLAFALVDAKYANLGTQVYIQIRKHKVPAKIRNKKFLEKKYIK